MKSDRSKSEKMIRRLLIYLAVSLFFGVPAALISGIWPKTALGWILIVIFAIPVMFVGGFVGEILFSDKVSDALDPRRKTKKISLVRMAYAALIGMAYIGLIQLIMKIFGDKIRPHFYFP